MFSVVLQSKNVKIKNLLNCFKYDTLPLEKYKITSRFNFVCSGLSDFLYWLCSTATFLCKNIILFHIFSGQIGIRTYDLRLLTEDVLFIAFPIYYFQTLSEFEVG